MGRAKTTRQAEVHRGDQDRRRSLLRAAIDAFAERGYHRCRISDVARRAGVAHGLVYHYFASKEALLQAVFELSWTGFVERVRAAAAGAGPFESRVRAVIGVTFDAYRADPSGVRVLLLEVLRSPVQGRGGSPRHSALAEVIRLGQGMFEDASAAGELAAQRDPWLCASMLFGSLEMALTAFILDQPSAGAEVLARAESALGDAFLHGVL